MKFPEDLATPPGMDWLLLMALGVMLVLLFLTWLFQLIAVIIICKRTKKQKTMRIKDETTRIGVFNESIGGPRIPKIAPFVEVPLNQISTV